MPGRIWLGLGAALGVIFGSAIGNIGLGIGLGVALGLVVSRRHKPDNSHPKSQEEDGKMGD